MSPSLLDTGAPNGGDLSFGDQMNPNLNINAPSASRSSVQARPKLVKIKKQSNSKKFESMGNPGSGNEAGFIPFRPVVENLGTNVSAFGNCGSVSGEFGFGKAGNEPFVFQTSSSNNLGAKPGRNVLGKIDGSTNVFDVDDSRKSIFNDGGQGIGSTPVLPEEMKNLTIKEPENTDGSGKSEAIGAANVSIPSSGENFRAGSGVFGMSTSTAFPERKDGFVFASKVDAKAPPIIEFKIPSLLSGSGKKLDLSAKVNQRRGKSNQAMPVKLSAVQGFVSTKDVFDKGVGAAGAKEESVSAAETESFKSANKGIDSNIDTSTSSSSSSFVFSSNPRSGMDFTFSTSDSQSQPSVSRPHHKKKNSAQIAHDSNKIGQNVGIPHAPYSGASLLSSPMQNQKEYVSVSSSKAGDNHASDKGQEIKHELDLTSAASATAQGACERWRSRGNQAYTKGDLSKAEDWYTQGISSVPKSEKSRSCLRALMLCYSNRAATRISLGKVRDALGDCLMAVAIDPHFIKVQIRAASCHLALGEVEDASRYFRKCLQSGSDVCVDRKVAVEASEGLKNAQKVSECMHCSADLLQKKASDDAEKALELIAEALQISSYSEKLLRMKAESLLMLHKYEEVIQLCEQTYASAERNSPPLDGQQADVDDSEILKDSAFRIWRCCMIFKSYFHLGRLEDAVAYLEKQEELQSVAKRNRSDTLESSIQLAATVRELLQHKTLGNEAFQSGKYAEAIEHYSAALSCNAESRPFSAICFCNRAAAYKALGQITDAIADCSLAIALDRNFLKAISRRATLYKMVRDNGQAAKDFQRLVSLITKQIQEKTEQLGGQDKSMKLANDLRQARLQLYEIEEDAIKQCPRNMYLIMGIQPSASASEIKKAYRKAALRHHPDKAVQALGRYDNGDDKLWKQIRDDAYKEADKLFKVIGEAYAVLSDPTKRSQYDLEEGKRNVQKAHTGSTSRASTDAPSYSYDRTDWREAQRSYGVSSTRGPEAVRSSRYY